MIDKSTYLDISDPDISGKIPRKMSHGDKGAMQACLVEAMHNN